MFIVETQDFKQEFTELNKAKAHIKEYCIVNRLHYLDSKINKHTILWSIGSEEDNNLITFRRCK